MKNSSSKVPPKRFEPYPTHSLRQFLAHQSLQQSTPLHQEAVLDLEVDIDIGDGRREVIRVNSSTNIDMEAQELCERNNLEPFVWKLLSQSIKDQYDREVSQQQHQRQTQISEEFRKIYAPSSAQEVLLTTQSPPKNSPLEEITHTYESQGPEMLWQPAKSKKENLPPMNVVSRLICDKYGKQNILMCKQRRSREKLEGIKRLKEARQQEELKQCHFRPKINAISQKVNDRIYQNPGRKTQRHEILYSHFQQKIDKHTSQKEREIAQIPFRPCINSVSRQIVQDKQLLADSHLTKQSTHSHCRQQPIITRPKTGRKPSNRNQGNLPIGEYLYRQDRRFSKPQIQQNKDFKALDYSDLLVSVLKEKKMKQLFVTLTRPPHEFLSPNDLMGLQTFQGIHKQFIPLFEEIIQLGVSLSEQNFIEAGIRLVDSLAPHERHQLMFKKQTDNSIQNSNQSRGMSRQSSGELYARGVERTRLKQTRLQRIRQQKARSELKRCTFRPILY